MGEFLNYLSQAKEALISKYPTVQGLEFYNGEYRPNIINFQYMYNFATAKEAYQVVVNTSNEGVHFLIHSIPRSILPPQLRPISLPIKLGLEKAFQLAADQGYKPNIGGAITFFQDDPNTAGPSYWFLDENDSSEWILVSEEGAVTTTKMAPDMP